MADIADSWKKAWDEVQAMDEGVAKKLAVDTMVMTFPKEARSRWVLWQDKKGNWHLNGMGVII